MGVPGLFLWLLKKYDLNNLINKKTKEFDCLLIDTNCLLHPQCFKILDECKESNIYKLENKMIDECLNYIDKLIKYINPKKLVYISIDGVVPCAKIKQQRLRRFKSAKDKTLFNNLKKKYKKPLDSNWTNASITPGTVFMHKLHIKIKEYIKKYKNIKIIYSSCYVEGEGEHKLLQYIKTTDEKYDNYVIYGLDADLIFLSLSTLKSNMYLLRESQEINKKLDEQLLLIDIDIISELIYDEFIYSINSDVKLIKDNIIIDFIFICFFLGNDFLPHLPSLTLHNNKKLDNGLDLLLYCYCKTFKIYNKYIININTNNIEFNQEFIINFLDNLILFENDYLIKNYKLKKWKRNCNSDNLYEREKFRIENLQFKIEDKLELGKDTEELWKYRYYNHYYKCSHNITKTINDACFEYFKGLIWNSHYYYLKCPSWEWYYKFNHGPFLSDLRVFIKTFNFNTYKFKLGISLTPLKQLICVLPPQYAFLLPKKYKYFVLNSESEIIHLYPRDFELDMINKNKYWQCIPFIPNMEFKKLNIIDKIKLEKYDIIRNYKEKILVLN